VAETSIIISKHNSKQSNS